MKHASSKLMVSIAAFIAISAASWAQSPSLQVGEPIPKMTLSDQHEKPWLIPADTKLVLFSVSRNANTLVQSILSQKNSGYLSSKKVVYFSDLSKMPGFITRTFALPSMRDLPYSVGIVLNAEESQSWPREEDAVTAVFLSQGRISKIEYIKNAEFLQQTLEQN
jgi:hypothetical protein